MKKPPLAIVGMGAILPGAPTPKTLWEALQQRSRKLREPGASIGFDARLHVGSGPGRTPTLHGGWLTDEWQLDWRSFRIPPADAAAGNKMQFVTLAVGAQALEHVRVVPRQRTAILLGATGLGFQKDGGLRTRADDLREAIAGGAAFGALDAAVRERVRAAVEAGFAARVKVSSSDNTVGSLASVAAARIAMHLDLYGAHYAVDADHASALAALELGIAGLRDGEWDCALVGGVSELLTPGELIAYAQRGVLSSSGTIAPFSTSADGTLLGEGAGMLALKRLDDALRDGDTIHALVHEVGRAGSTSGPAEAVMADAIAAALDGAGVAPSEVGLVECDAGGIVALDELEARALARVFTEGAGPALSAVKANLGHLRAAAGAAGLVATALSLHHRELAPTLAGEGTIPSLGGRGTFVREARAWPSGARAIAGVSAASIDGQCFHAVLEAFVPEQHGARTQVAVPRYAFAPLAVLGLGGIYAGAPDVPRFWENLLAGRDEVVDVPASRWDLARYHSRDPKALDKSYAKKGSFVELPAPRPEDAVEAGAVAQLDPTQLLVVRAAEQAVAEAGATGIAPDRVGVFLAFMPFQGRRWASEAGVNARELYAALGDALGEAKVGKRAAAKILEESERRFGDGLPPINEHSLTGWLGSSAAARIAHRFGYTGPTLAIETACASTLAALHAAAQALHHGRCDLALVAGAFADIEPEFYVATSRFNGLSPDGISPFDASAKGFVPGEGAGVLVLQRLDDAHAAGRRVRAIVRACAGSSDGKGRSVFTPSVEGESLALQQALASAQLEGQSVGYVECHGTGTTLGDSVEAMALACSYGGEGRATPLRIGSVKSNLGHLIAGAGAPALTKAILSVEHGEIPPSLHCEHPSPKIDFVEGRLEVVRARTAWPEDARPRRAGVSAFGIGGSNFHAIVEEPGAPPPTGARREPQRGLEHEAPADAPALFAFAGDDVRACADELGAMSAMLAEVSGEDFRDAAQTTRERASASGSPARLALVTATSAELERRADTLASAVAAGRALAPFEALGVYAASQPLGGTCAILFPGQGSQYAGMLAPLAAARPVIERLLARADVTWQALTGRALRGALWPRGKASAPPHEDLHAAVYTVNCALHGLMRNHGIVPALFIGQSAGEISALVAADALSFEDGLRAIHARTHAVLALPLADPGRMAAVACGAARLRELLRGIDGSIGVAAENCPTSSLATGETRAMAELERRCAAAGVDYKVLEVSHAYHSDVIAGAGPRYRAVLESLSWRPPRGRVLSTVDLEMYDADVARSIDRLVRQYTVPVRFEEAIERAYAGGTRLFLEAGPKWPLTSYVREILGARPYAAQASIHPKVGEVQQLLRLVACAYVHHVGTLEPKEERAGAEPRVVLAPARAVIATAPAIVDGDPEARVRRLLIFALAERTGYPEDMLELDLDLEGDLGIDTVKQVEVFGRVREELGLPREEGLSLRQLSTLRKVIERFVSRLSTEVVVAAPQAVVAAPQAVVAAPQGSTTPPPEHPRGPGSTPTGFDEVRALVVHALSERTGYPEDMLELDLDLEGDLGIDTVKQVEVFGRVREELGLGREEGISLRQLNTLRKVIERFVARAAIEGSPAPAPSAPISSSTAVVVESAALARYPLLGRIIERSATRLVVERTFLPAQDEFLLDARIAGRACVPASMAWEALAEAAEVLLDAPITNASALRTAGPLFLGPAGKLVVRLEAERRGDRVEATLALVEGAAQRIRYGAELGAEPPAPIVVAADVKRALDRRGQTPNAHAVAAQSAVHMGEALGGAVWARSLSFCELIGGIRAESEALFGRIDAPRLVLAPAVLECAFMLAGFGWYALARQSGLPFELERVTLGRAIEPGEELLCHVRIRSSTGETVISDVLVLGADRAPVLRLAGLRLMRVDRIVDMVVAEADDAVSWTRFCRALREPGGGGG